MTTTFKLLTGVECEIKAWTGKHQKMLTIQDGRSFDEKITDLLRATIVRIGSCTDITKEVVDSLLAGDRKYILVVARQYSLGHEDMYILPFAYTDKDGRSKTEEVRIPLVHNQFPTKLMQLPNEAGEYEDAIFNEYSEVPKQQSTVLPMSGTKVQFYLLDGVGTNIATGIRTKDKSSNTAFTMRRVTYMEKSKNGNDIAVSLNIDNTPLRDLEHIRKMYINIEPNVNTGVTFNHPETGAETSVDVLSQISFFFPSGAI